MGLFDPFSGGSLWRDPLDGIPSTNAVPASDVSRGSTRKPGIATDTAGNGAPADRNTATVNMPEPAAGRHSLTAR